MKKKILSTLALICGGSLLCLAMVADISGKWTGALKTPNGDFPLTYTFKVDGDKLTGNIDGGQGGLPIDSGKVSATDLSFNVSFNGNVIKSWGKIYADSIGLDSDFGGRKSHITLKRAQ